MATKNIVPQADGEGSIGTAAKKWGDGRFTTLSATGLITATGGQIAFPATAVPSADPNTLDDYEEGTFGDSGANEILVPAVGTITCDTAYTCQYTKIGRQVTVVGYAIPSAVAGQSGTTYIILPFLVGDSTSLYAQGSVMLNKVDFTADYVTIQAAKGGVEGRLTEVRDDATIAYLDAAGISAGDTVSFGLTYFI